MIPRHKHEAIVAQLEQEKREAFEAGYQKGYLHASIAEDPDPIEAWKDYEERRKLKP